MTERIERARKQRKEEQVVAAILHMSTPWGFLALLSSCIVWATSRSRSRFLTLQALQAFLFQLLSLGAFGLMFVIFMAGFYFAAFSGLIARTGASEPELTSILIIAAIIGFTAIFFFRLILPLWGFWAGVKVLRGHSFHYPILGKLAIRWTSHQPFEIKSESPSERYPKHDNDNIIAGLSHASILFNFSLFLSPILWATNKPRSQYLSHHLLQASIFQITTTILVALIYTTFWISGALVGLLQFIGFDSPEIISTISELARVTYFPFSLFVLIGSLCLAIGIYAIIATVQTIRGKEFHYPFIGKWLNDYLMSETSDIPEELEGKSTIEQDKTISGSEMVQQPVFRKYLNVKKIFWLSCSSILLFILLIPFSISINQQRTRPDVLWHYPVGNTVMSAPTIADGVVYFGSLSDMEQASFFALETTSGKELWTKPLNGSVTWSPLIATDLVYVGTDEGFLYALDKNTGEQKWAFSPQQRELNPNSCDRCALKLSQPIIDNNHIYFGSLDHSLYALDAQTGSLLWRFSTGDTILEAPSISNGEVYVGSSDGNIYVIESETGQELRRYFVPFQNGVAGETGVFGTPIVDANTVYAINGSLVAIDMQTGKLKWQFEKSSPFDQIVCNALTFEDNIIVTIPKALYAIDKTTGEIHWKFTKLKGDVFFSPTLEKGIIYFGDTSGYIYMIDANTGRKIRQYNLNLTDLSSFTNFVSEFVFTPAVEEDVIYVGWYNYLYAIRNGN